MNTATKTEVAAARKETKTPTKSGYENDMKCTVYVCVMRVGAYKRKNKMLINTFSF